MSTHLCTDTNVDLVINRLPLSVYNDLLSNDQIYKNELYLIDDPNFDVCDKRVINVNDPISANDAVNLEYVNSNFINVNNLTAYVDKSRIYSSNLTEHWPDGATYIDGNLKVYVKDTTPSKWEIAVLQGSVSPEDVTVISNSGFGWQFSINGYTFGQNFARYPDTLRESTTYQSETVEICATSWHLSTELLKKSDLDDPNSYLRQTISAIVNSMAQ